MATLMLIDGNSLTYRAFHALPQDLATASGQVTNAVFGFTSMLINLVRDHQPDGIAVAFDRPEPTFRHEQVETYKANRSAAPDILRQQMGLVRQVLDALNIPQLDKAGVEADDILATLAEQAADAGLDVLIVTGDRDSYQLVRDPHIKVVYNKRGVSDYAVYDEAGIAERTGVAPDRYVSYAALRGDNSDNLPGVPGVGEKTAAKLINTYGSIDGIYQHVEDQTPKLSENLAANEDQVRMNEIVMELVRDVELDVAPTELVGIEPYDREQVKELFDFLEFRTLLGRLEDAMASNTSAGHDHQELAVSMARSSDAAGVAAAVTTLAEHCRRSSCGVAMAGEYSPDGALVGLALAPLLSADQVRPERSKDTSEDTVEDTGQTVDPVEVVLVALSLIAAPSAEGSSTEVGTALNRLLGADGPDLFLHDGKPLIRELMDHGIDAAGLDFDTSLAAYLLDPAGNAYPLDILLAEKTRLRRPEGSAPPEGQLDLDGSSLGQDHLAALDAASIAALGAMLAEEIEANGLLPLNVEVEVPLVRVLAAMEHVGIAIDREELEALNTEMTDEAAQLSKLIQEDAGEEFNVNSTKALREILFDKLELKPQKKTKTGYSTDQATLEKLVGEHPIVEHLLRYREVEKLRSTYGQSLLDAIADDGRIHATFNQTVARTGRLSSENPNLHNIPVRTEMGRNFRKAFVAPGDQELLVADYNQIELRCIAHLAGDPGLIAAFTAGDDIHAITAARVFDVDADAVTIEQRSKSKMVSYGLAYGMEAYGLGQRLNIPTREAQEILDAYFEGFPAVKDYMTATVTEARNRGYTETLFGRRRAIPELMSDNRNLRMAGERQAMNAGIQGLAADIFKVALVRIHRRLAAEARQARLVLQVHDEVLLEVPTAERDEVADLVVQEMSGAFDLDVPLEVNLSFGRTWADAKD